jgi:AraC-like DNA-binding protein
MPMSTVDLVTFKDLAESEQFRNFYAMGRELAQVRLTLSDPEMQEGKRLYVPEDEGPLCRLIHTTSAGRSACRHCTLAHCRTAADAHGLEQYVCHAGLIDFVVPIYVEARLVAYFSCGQLLPEPPSSRLWPRYRKLAKRFRLDPAEVRVAYFATPSLSQSKLDQVNRLLAFFAEYFREVGRRVKQKPQPSFKAIERARDYVESHFREPIRIQDVSKHVGMSPGYLSTLFSHYEGVTLVRFLQQTRITEARKRLEKPAYTVTEIAYEVGFNSVTHFNRVFKKLVACSPSQYRQRAEFLWNACVS